MLEVTMDCTHTLWLDVLGHRVQIEIAGDAAAAEHARERALEAWGELVISERPAAPGPDDIRHDAHAPLVFTVNNIDEVEHLLDQLSSRATLAGIEARSGELLMLHAAGLADPKSGHVVACVAPSGTGKTTLSRAAAGKLLYVTDETVAVTRSGEIVHYPKPLSVKQRGNSWAPKSQHHPEQFGLEVAGSTGLSLGAIVLLARELDERDERDANDTTSDTPATATPPWFEQVDLFDAMVALVPELSYLSRMPKPLHWLAETLLSVGGVQRLHYSQAAHAIPLLQELLRGDSPAADAAVAASISRTLAISLEEYEQWQDSLTKWSVGQEGDTGDAFAEIVTEIDDMLIDPETGRTLIFSDNVVHMISSVAAATLLAAREGLTTDSLRAYLSELFGEPTPGSEPIAADPAADPIAEVVRILTGHGLLA